jgi:nucleotide-binding universal stress UspA family protein
MWNGGVPSLSISKILLPADFSARSTGAAHAAGAAARDFQAEVTALHVIEPRHNGASSEKAHAECREQLNRLISETLVGCRARPRVMEGDPAACIVECANTGLFDLIMMPTHGHGAFRRFLLGSVTAKVLHDASQPVWTSTHMENWPAVEHAVLRGVLCGVDFGPRTEAALNIAAKAACRYRANLTVLHAIPLLDTYSEYEAPEWRNTTIGIAERRIQQLLKGIEVIAAIQVVDGAPASALRETAERLDADLVVIGRTHSSIGPRMLGSNAYSIIARSPCPVLSV